MATPTEIAASLSMDDIPVKLRCAGCNKLAMNAFRVPCCDQTICEDCQAGLAEACPICLHEPVNAEDCRPNKAMRTTIKVFLKKKVMERETARKKEALSNMAATPATPATPLPDETSAPQPSQTPVLPASDISSEGGDAKQGFRDSIHTTQAKEEKADEQAVPTEAQKDIPQMSIEFPSADMPRRASTQTAGEGSVSQEKADNEKQPEQQQMVGQNEQWAANNGFGQGMNNDSFSFDGTSLNFPMGFNNVGDFSQMMQFMPNGMANNMMGPLPNMMVGMPGMGMDPVAMSQGIYGGFGGQGMGMNGMNMGMGFNAGQGAFGGFNGQSPAAWNAGQDKFNQNAYGGHAGMGGGDFGANTGYGGYNMPPHQGNFNQMHHHQYPNNDFHHGHHGQGFQSRGRGRGRGYPNAGRGRGGYHQISQGNQANYEPLHQQTPPQVTRRGSPQYGPIEDRPAHQQKDRATTDNQQELKSAETADVLTAEEQLSKELDPGDAEDNDEKKPPAVPSNEAQVVDSTDRVVTETEASEKPQTDPAPKMEEEKPAPIQTYISDEPPQSKLPVAEGTTTVAPVMMPPPSPMIPTGPAALHAPDQPLESSSRGRGAGRGFHRGVPDYRVGSHGRGSGYLSNGNQPHIQPTPLVVKPIVPPASPKGLGVEGAPKAPKALREGLPNTGVRGFSIVGRASAVAQSRPNGRTTTRSPSRERSRSPSRHRSSHRRHHRHRSPSVSSDDERERRRERHRRHSRKHEEENGEAHESKGSRTRDASADSSTKRSSHRSRRDYGKEKESSHRSHRSHRNRSREGDADYRSSRKRSKSPDITINGASRRSAPGATTNGHGEKHDESTPPSRKRRSDDEGHHRDHKRSRRGQKEVIDEKEDSHRARPSKGEEKELRSNHDRVAMTQDKLVEKGRPKSPPKGPKLDQHAMDREACNAVRVAREEKRKARAMIGGAVATGKSGKAGRRVSYKYEDELQVENEAVRYR